MSVAETGTRGPIRVAAALLIGIPVLLIAWVLLGDYGAFFWDAGTFPCGIEAMLATGDPNAYLNPAYPGRCAGSRWQYMQAPAVTAVLGSFVGVFGMNALIALYGGLYAASLGFLGWVTAQVSGGRLALPLLFFATLSCGIFIFEVASGNLSIVFAGLLCAAILQMDRRPALTVVLCVAAAAFKPHYALYLLIPLIARRNYLAVSFAAAAVSLWYALDAVLHPEAFARWLELILPIVHREPHFGFMRWMQEAGYAEGDWLLLGGVYVLWCAGLLVLTLRMCATMSTPIDRAFAALACVTLMLPRLKEYDCLVIVPLFFWLAAHLAESRMRWLQRLVFALGFAAPAAVWWFRKLPLLMDPAGATLRAAAEMKWLLQNQGVYLVAAFVIVFGTMALRFARAPRRASPPSSPAADEAAAPG